MFLSIKVGLSEWGPSNTGLETGPQPSGNDWQQPLCERFGWGGLLRLYRHADLLPTIQSNTLLMFRIRWTLRRCTVSVIYT